MRAQATNQILTTSLVSQQTFSSMVGSSYIVQICLEDIEPSCCIPVSTGSSTALPSETVEGLWQSLAAVSTAVRRFSLGLAVPPQS
jgi:hypothetical protein